MIVADNFSFFSTVYNDLFVSTIPTHMKVTSCDITDMMFTAPLIRPHSLIVKPFFQDRNAIIQGDDKLEDFEQRAQELEEVTTLLFKKVVSHL